MLRALLAGVLTLASTPVLAVQDPMTAARDLYASAAYEEALTALQVIKDRGESALTRQAEEYRAFCFLALGRTSEAESAAESAVRQDPLATVDSRDASPRVEALFTSVRRRVLPSLIRDAYRAARDRMNQGQRTQGMEDLERVRHMLDAARTLNIADEALTDMTVLVDGFLELRRAEAAPARPLSPAAPAPAKTATPEPVLAAETAAPPVAAPPSAPRADSLPKIYTAVDTAIVAPVAVRQDVPEIILDTSSRKRTAVIEVTIDERGGVRSAIMRESISAWIDEQLLKAARAWRYRPATRDGEAVPYRKVIGIAIGGGEK